MVAKVPKAKIGVKSKPHMKAMTKTIVKRKKNKAVNGIKETSLKTMKKKKLGDLKKKAVAEEKSVKVLKKKPMSKKLKGTEKLKMIKESESSSLLVHENGKEHIDTEEISPKVESSAVGSDISTGGGRSVVAVEVRSEPVIFPDLSVSHCSSEFMTEETIKDISPKASPNDKKKAGKGKIRKVNGGIIKKKDNVVTKKKGKVSKQKAVSGVEKAVGKDIKKKLKKVKTVGGIENAAAKDIKKLKKAKTVSGIEKAAGKDIKKKLKKVRTVSGIEKKAGKNIKKKLKRVAPMSVTKDLKSDSKDDDEYCGTLSSDNDGDNEQSKETPADDDSKMCVGRRVGKSANKKFKKNSGKRVKTEVAPMSFVEDIEDDYSETHRPTMRPYIDRKVLKKRERELVMELFGDLSRATMGEDTVARIFPKKKKRKIKKSKKGENIPKDPYDIHDMKVSEPGKQPAWVDDDDEDIRVKDVVASMTKARGTRGIRETSDKKYTAELREKFTNVIGSTPEWADLNFKPEEDSDDHDFIKKTGNYLSGQSSSLPKTTLEYKQMADLNSSHTEGAFIQAIDFNPHLQVGLVAGTLRSLGAASLFQVDGNANLKIQSIRFPNFPITSAQFLRDGKKFVVGSNFYNYFYIYDLETSKETKLLVNKKFERGVKKNLHVSPDGKLLIHLGPKGKIYIYDSATLSLVDTMEAPHPLTCATITSDGSKMYTHGLTGEVCTWDLTARECVHKFYDEGCIAGDAIAVSPNNQYLACGSRSGIVNVYEVSNFSSESYPGPTKVLSNLTTNITALTFNATSEILAMASNLQLNAMKLVHFPSMTVFENFPRLGSVMKKAEAIRFSPQSGYLAVGNIAGAASMFRLKHYSSY